MNEVEESLPDLLLGALSYDGGRDQAFEKILKLVEKPDYLEYWNRKITVDILVHLSLVVIDDGEAFDHFHELVSTLCDSSQFEFMVNQKDLNSDSMADLLGKVGDVLDKPYALIYAMLFKIIARGEMPPVFFQREERLDHIGVLLALSQSCSTETEENALSAIFNFGVVSNALEPIVERDSGYLIRLAKIVMEGSKIGKSLALTMLAQLVYKNIDRKKLLSARSLKLTPYLTQLVRDRNDQELRDKAIKLLSGLADLPDNKIDFVTTAGTQSILPDLFNILDEEYSESRNYAILILWSLATDHKANQELFFMPQYRLVSRLQRILIAPNESRRNALGLLSVIVENNKLSETILEENILPPLILSIAANESQDSIRANALIIISKMAESSVWKQLLVAQGNELLDELFATASNEQFNVSRDFAVRTLYSLANEYPIISKYCFKFVTKFLDILEKDEMANKFKILQFIGSVLSNEENQRTVLYEAQRKNASSCLLHRIISLVLAIIHSPNGSCLTDSQSAVAAAANSTSAVTANANLVAMTKSVAIDVIRALCDKNTSLQHLLFHSKFQLIEALGLFLDQPDPIQGNHDPKVVALIVLYNVAGNDDLKSDFVDPKLNVLGRILRVLLLPASPENSRAKSFATGTICRLVSKHTDNQILFANPSLGVLPILISSIRNPDTPWKAKEFALGALVHIAKLPANHWVAFDPEMALFSTTFDLLRDVKKDDLTNANGGSKKTNNRFYVLGVIDDLLEAYDRPDGSQINVSQREALLKELYEIASEQVISPTKAKAMRLLLILSAGNGFILTIQSHRVDLVNKFVSFLAQLCEPLSTAVSAQNLGEKTRRIYLSCISQFTNIKRVKAITSFLRTESLHLFPTLYRFLTLSSTSQAEETLVSSILWNMAENGDQEVSMDLVRHNIHVFALDLLQETIRRRSEMDEFRTQLLNMLMNMARHFSVRESLINAGAVEVAEKLLNYHHRESSLSSSMFTSLLENGSSTPSSTRESTSNVDDANNNAMNQASNSGGVTPIIRNNNPMNSLKALLILLFLFGNEEAKDTSLVVGNSISPKASSSISERVVTTDRLKTLIDIFSLTLQCRGGKDFLLGTFCLPLIVDACLVISQSDSNKTSLISLGVVPLLTKALVMYANNQSAIPNCGGGGNDDETATLAVETLLHLSFSFGSQNAALQEAFLKGNTLLVEILPALQEKTNLLLDAKNKAAILQYRLTTKDGRDNRPSSFHGSAHSIDSGLMSPDQVDHAVPREENLVGGGPYASVGVDVRRISMADGSALTLSDPQLMPSMHLLPSSSSSSVVLNQGFATASSLAYVAPKHVMLSYCWDPTANPGYVKKLSQELKRLGFDVWRDEDGSSLLPALSGTIDDRLAEAIEKSHTVVICVSAAYKRSSSCRLEATYAHALSRRNKVKIVFVMMNENYTTMSSPTHCDGWLGFMIGDNLWYSMWHESRVANVAMELAKMLPEETKLTYRERLTAVHNGKNTNGGGTPVLSTGGHRGVVNSKGSGDMYNDPESLSVPNNITTNNNNNNNSSTAFVQQENPMFQQPTAGGASRRLSSTNGSSHSLTTHSQPHVNKSATRDSNENQDEDYESVTSFSMEDIYTNDSISEKVEDAKNRSFEDEKDTPSYPLSTMTHPPNRTAMGRQSLVLHNARRESHTFASAHSNLANNSNNNNHNNNFHGNPNFTNNYNNNDAGNAVMTSNPLASSVRRQSAAIASSIHPNAIEGSNNPLLHTNTDPISKLDDGSSSNIAMTSNDHSAVYRSPLNRIFNSQQPLPHSSGKRGSIISTASPPMMTSSGAVSVTNNNNHHHQYHAAAESTGATAEDTMTEITSEEDVLSAAFRVLSTVEWVKDVDGLQDYLLEEGINTVDLLGYCDPEDWRHLASFLRNKPRKRFMELMLQWQQLQQQQQQQGHQPSLNPLHLLSSPPSAAMTTSHPQDHLRHPPHADIPLSLPVACDSTEDYRVGLPSYHTQAVNKEGKDRNADKEGVDDDNDDDYPAGKTCVFCALPEWEMCVIS